MSKHHKHKTPPNPSPRAREPSAGRLEGRQDQHIKYMRNLVKRLKQIDALREEQANGRALSPGDEVINLGLDLACSVTRF